jgi:hypothetical protein
MPTTYRGKVRIECKQDVCITDKAVADVTPQCLACAESVAVVIDLEEKPVGVIQKPAAPETEDPEPPPEEKPVNPKRKKY